MYSRLPARPNLDHLRNQAKTLLTALRSQDAAASGRARASYSRYAEATAEQLADGRFALADAQHVIAREYGFPSWPRMKRYVEGIEPYSGDRGLSAGRYTVEAHGRRAQDVLRQAQDGDAAALMRLRAYVPRFLDATDEELRQEDVTLEDAQQVVAREHAFASWSALVEWFETRHDVEERIAALCACGAGDHGAMDELLGLLRENTHRWLAVCRGGARTLGFGEGKLAVAKNCASVLRGEPTPPDVHRETLERFVVEGLTDALMITAVWTPTPEDEVVHVLLDAGAAIGDVTIGHQTALEAAIMDRGADAKGLIDRLASQRVHRNCLWVAAGAGQLDLVKSFFDSDGALTPDAGSHRMNMANLGHPSGLPKTDDRQEIVDEALFAACRKDRLDVAEYLVAQGADVNATHDIFDDTPLTWAEHVGADTVAGLLRSHGAVAST